MNKCLVATAMLVAALMTGFSVPAHAIPITVDQILYKLNTNGGLTQSQAANLSATVDMTFDSSAKLLTVILTNTSGLTTVNTNNASNLLTGLGFNLPNGVSAIDSPTYNSTVAVTSGSTLIGDPDNTLSQDNWGWRGNNTGGHFSVQGVLPVNLILSTSSADVLQTFTGGSRNLVDGTDYGLMSSSGSPGPGSSPYIKDSVTFSIYLSGTTGSFSNMLSYIQSQGVVAAYGSPADAQGQILTTVVSEPGSLILAGSGLIGFAGFGLVRKKRFYTRI